MNDIKTIEELRADHERLKAVVTALKRLEEGEKGKDAQSGTDEHPTSPHSTPLCGGRTLKTRVNTKGPKGQRIKGSSPPQAHVFNPERNELKNRLVGCSVPIDFSVPPSSHGTKRCSVCRSRPEITVVPPCEVPM